jgi:hypothetical protein
MEMRMRAGTLGWTLQQKWQLLRMKNFRSILNHVLVKTSGQLNGTARETEVA